MTPEQAENAARALMGFVRALSSCNHPTSVELATTTNVPEPRLYCVTCGALGGFPMGWVRPAAVAALDAFVQTAAEVLAREGVR